MGNNFCCPARNSAKHDQIDPNAPHLFGSVLLHGEKSIIKPLGRMTRNSKRSGIGQNSPSLKGNNTVYHSFDNSLESAAASRITLGASKGDGIPFHGNILSQIGEDETQNTSETTQLTTDKDSQHSDNHQPIITISSETDSRRSYNELRKSRMQAEGQNCNVISEENEDDHEDAEEEEESFYDPNSTLKDKRSETSEYASVLNILDDEKLKTKGSFLSRASISRDNQRPDQHGLNESELLENAQHTEWMKFAAQWLETAQGLNEKDYAGFDRICDEKKSSHGLKMYLSSYENDRGNKVNQTRSEWTVPFRAEQYIKFMANFDEQRALDKNIDIYTHVETFCQTEESWYSIYYIAYKQVLVASPRDFLYIKYVKKIDENTWCDVSKSIVHPDYPEFKDKVRGEIIVSGSTVTQFTDPQTGKTMSKVKLYSENNFKLNIPNFLTKSFASGEMKKFIELVIKRMGVVHPE